MLVHLTSWLSPRGGGIPPAIFGLAREQIRSGERCVIAGLSDPSLPADGPVPGARTILGKAIGPDAVSYSRELEPRVCHAIGPGAVIHSHGLWMHSGMVARRVARARSLPLVVAPHGMLESWALANSGWKKRLAGWIFENRNLRAADCLHALCPAEARDMRAYGLSNPIAIVPNGIDPMDFEGLPDRRSIERDFPILAGRRRLLFLSRIHRKKGLDHLLKAWHQVSSEFRDWALVIAGSGFKTEEARLHGLVSELGLAAASAPTLTAHRSPLTARRGASPSPVLFTGPLHGAAKLRALAGADAFVLPSFSEGFSMAILEAAAAGLPVLLSPQCNFPELVAAGGAMEMAPDAQNCASALRRLLAMAPDKRADMGRCGRDLVHRDYTWKSVAAKMRQVYDWLRRKSDRPDAVRLGGEEAGL